KQPLTIHNPFLLQTKILYPQQYQIPQPLLHLLNSPFQITFPHPQIPFIPLHIYTSLTNSHLSSVNQNSPLIPQLLS
ncbi:PRD domain-containing protein, partial [Bacillus thuringiensis]|uniref:PRD domain-containing protein n=1 Tax=Bacillus thuringiensis TaxID=1428 RepID=UPI0011A7E0E4